MTASIWIASPPEAHSALLSSGPGSAPLLAAAEAWTSLSTEYASAAEELTALLGAAQGSWEGPAAEQYLAAHAPYLAWLEQAGADSAGVAAQHETAAAAYTAALAAMPTLAELAANHAIHGVLVATNFFGINTIPIAINEADYVRMWIQDATTMGTYQAVSGAAVASAPRTTSAPMVLKTSNAVAAADPPRSGNFFTDLHNEIVQLIQNPSAAIAAIMANPSAYGPLLFLAGFAVYEVTSPLIHFTYIWILFPIIQAIVEAAAGAPQLAGVPEPGAIGPQPTLAGMDQPKTVGHPVGAMAPTTAAPTAPAAPASAPGATAGAAPAPAAAAFAYLVGGFSGPDAGPGPTFHDRKGVKSPAARIPAAAVGVASREKSRARRRRRAAMNDYGDEFMDMGSDPGTAPQDQQPTSTTASDSGVGRLGFGGTVRKDTTEGAAGLATLAGDEFGGGPTVPMVPGTWDADTEPADDSRDSASSLSRNRPEGHRHDSS
jgi:PPE-repeat protein